MTDPIKYQSVRRAGQPARYSAHVTPSVRDAARVRVLGIKVQELTNERGNRTGWRATGKGFDGGTYAFSVGRTRDEAVEGLLHRGIKVDDTEVSA